jgi:hypothetical protein
MTLTDVIAKVTRYAKRVIVNDNSSSDAVRITQTGSGNALVVEDSASPDSTPFVVKADGSVGVGTTSLLSGTKVDVKGSLASTQAWIGTDGSTDFIIDLGKTGVGSYRSGYLIGASSNITLLNQENGAIRLGTNNALRLSINNAGDVGIGIGTATPSSRLHIAGDITVQSATTSTTVGAAGAASALPATPEGYLVVNINGTARKIPFYNV